MILHDDLIGQGEELLQKYNHQIVILSVTFKYLSSLAAARNDNWFYSFTSSFKNFQSGFKDSIRAFFFCLFHFLISFSLSIACSI